MMIYKFGGASLATADGFRNVAEIIADSPRPLTVVVSAMGKITNAFEHLLKVHASGQTHEAEQLLQGIIQGHQDLATDLNLDPTFLHELGMRLTSDLQQSMPDVRARYDQIVAYGELYSSLILHAYTNAQHIDSHWLDARQLIITDNRHQEARINWEATTAAIPAACASVMHSGAIITQGFIGGTLEGISTTLGREGSDFSAAILAYALDAESVTVWKDVPGVLNADPRTFPDTTKIDLLSYQDAIEMTYYGAQVLHPRTIQPLQRKNIPLYVKCFLKPKDSGTRISQGSTYRFLPPVIVRKEKQVLLEVRPLDFSFVAESHLSTIYSLLAKHQIKLNLTRHSAISFACSFDDDPERFAPVLEALRLEHEVRLTPDLTLITVKYYNEAVLAELKAGTTPLLEERSTAAAQILIPAH